MNLSFYFDEAGASNPYFKYIYNTLFIKFKEKYPEHNITHNQPDYRNMEHCPSCPGGYSHFQLINTDNNKSIVMSFWDRGMDILNPVLGWDKYDIVQYIGGLGMTLSSEEIKEKYGIHHDRYQYPLGVPNSYDYINEFSIPYNAENKIRKAVFIGSVYGTRTEIISHMDKHPLIEIFSQDKGYTSRLYFEKLKDYRMSMSFNGNGELCLRDLESMGLGIPLVRTGTHTQFSNPIIPDYHYIKTGPACDNACFTYFNSNPKEIAEQFIDAIEKNIDDYDRLNNLSQRGLDYFKAFCNPDYIIDLYFKLIKLDKINN
jgi:hypothetical protein